MSFVSPVEDPAVWNWRSSGAQLPSGLRYSGYACRLLEGDTASAAAIIAPCHSAVKHLSLPAFEILQLTPLANRFRDVSQALSHGVPTVYFLLPAGTALSVNDQHLVEKSETLATVNSVQIVLVFSDRIPREPVFAADIILAALIDSPDATDPGAWQAFTNALNVSTNQSDDAPVLLMDHSGRPIDDLSFTLEVGGVSLSVTFTQDDHGDLQAALARLHAVDPVAVPIANLWGRGATSARVIHAAGDSVQYALVEDQSHHVGSITITRATRHVLVSNLHDWFAPQGAIPQGASAPALERFTRDNRITPLVNGIDTFADMFAVLDVARNNPHGAFHLAAWSVDATQVFTQAPPGAAEGFPVTLEDAANALSTRGGSRFVAVDFIQVDDPSVLTNGQVMVVFLLVAGQLISSLAGPRDGTGAMLAFAAWLANIVVISWLSETDFVALEPNRSAVETLDAIDNTDASLSAVPSTVEDNPLAPPLADIDSIWTPEVVFDAIRHFSVFHQKISVVRTDASDFIGYCGGIDFHPNRIDDERHLINSPYHDVHAKITGPGVRDLMKTFDERLVREGMTPAFSPNDAATTATGEDIVQVARTYGTATNASRVLPFAPRGDRTLLDTTLNAIAQAREYIYIEDQYLTPPAEFVNAMVDRIASGELKKVIIVIPDIGDQPFGEIARSGAIDKFRRAAADAGNPDIVRVGSPRRHFTTPTSDLRSSSGRVCLHADLGEELSGEKVVFLGPPHRLPPVPFWVSINGELMWVYDESVAATAPGETAIDPTKAKAFKVERGDATRLVSGIESGVVSGIHLGKGPTPRAHKSGDAATVVDVSGIYVHSKLMLVDDVFLSIGSANLNRRGFYSDGECNLMSIPAALRASPNNPVRALRKKLWAEMLDLPLRVADPLLDDPVASAALFDRSYFFGNRFVRFNAFPYHVMIGNFAGGDGLVNSLLGYAGFAVVASSQEALFDTIVDPSSDLDPGL